MVAFALLPPGPGVSQDAEHVDVARHQVAACGRVLAATAVLVPAPRAAVAAVVVVVPTVVLLLPPVARVPIVVGSAVGLMSGRLLPVLLIMVVAPVLILLKVVAVMLLLLTAVEVLLFLKMILVVPWVHLVHNSVPIQRAVKSVVIAPI